MKIIDILTSPWAISPEKYAEIVNIYFRHARGETADFASIEAALGRKMDNEQARYEIRDGVAVIPVEGVLAKKMNMCTMISGGSSTQIIADDLRAALDNPAVEGVVLSIDSPGGSVDGTQELADIVYAGRSGKPIYAHADGLMASAAAWIGTSAEKVFIGSETTMTGSIGVVTAHTDTSGWEQKNGIKTTEIYAGKYKRIASQYAPLSDEGRRVLQDQVDYIYSVFVNSVAKNRGVSPETALETMADGKLFIGAQGIEAGLADGIATLGEVVNMVREASRARTGAGVVILSQTAASSVRGQAAQQSEQEITQTTTGGTAMSSETKATETSTQTATPAVITAETLRRDYPQVADALFQEGVAAGSTAERERIKDVEAQTVRGHEALIQTLKFDGKTTGAEAAKQVLAAMNQSRAKALATLEGEAPEPVKPSTGTTQAAASDPNASVEDRAKALWDANAELRKEFAMGGYDAFLALAKRDPEGVFGKRG